MAGTYFQLTNSFHKARSFVSNVNNVFTLPIANVHQRNCMKLNFLCSVELRPKDHKKCNFILISSVFSAKRVSITRIWNRVINSGTESGYPVLCYKSLVPPPIQLQQDVSPHQKACNTLATTWQ